MQQGTSPITSSSISSSSSVILDRSQSVVRAPMGYTTFPSTTSASQQTLIDLQSVAGGLVAFGWTAEAPAQRVGRSGAAHTFGLAASSERASKTAPSTVLPESQEDSTEFVVEVFVNETEVGEIPVLSFAAKTLDVGVKGRILVAIPSLSKEARKIAHYFGIKAIECAELTKISYELWNVLREFIDFSERLPSSSEKGEAIAPIVGPLKKSASSEQDGLSILFKSSVPDLTTKKLVPTSPSSSSSSGTSRNSASKRGSLDIITDILTLVVKPTSKTEILYRANLSFKQAQKYFKMLEKMDLISRNVQEKGGHLQYSITEKGRGYLSSMSSIFGRIENGDGSVWTARRAMDDFP